MSADVGEHKRSYFATRAEAHRYATSVSKKKTPNTSISIRKVITLRRRRTPWIVSVDQH
jgi:hypothetical protein